MIKVLFICHGNWRGSGRNVGFAGGIGILGTENNNNLA